MADEIGNTVACKVSHEALRAHAERVHFARTDRLFSKRIGTEELASDALMLRDLSTIMAARGAQSRAAPS
jgi:hypothetical protein